VPLMAIFLVGQIFVQQNATTCLSLRQEHSSADGVSTLQPQSSGTCFHHSSAHHPLVVDSLELGFSSHRPMYTSENFCCRVYGFALHLHFTHSHQPASSIHSLRPTDCSMHQTKLQQPQLHCPSTWGVEQSSC